jgi:hypothetical protein
VTRILAVNIAAMNDAETQADCQGLQEDLTDIVNQVLRLVNGGMI